MKGHGSSCYTCIYCSLVVTFDGNLSLRNKNCCGLEATVADFYKQEEHLRYISCVEKSFSTKNCLISVLIFVSMC